VRPRRSCDQRVGGVDGEPAGGQVGLVLTGTADCLPVGHEEPECIEERRRPASLLRAQSALDLSEVHARRGESVPFTQPASKADRNRRCVAEVADEHRRVEDVDGQRTSSVRRCARTHSLIAAWSVNCG